MSVARKRRLQDCFFLRSVLIGLGSASGFGGFRRSRKRFATFHDHVLNYHACGLKNDVHGDDVIYHLLSCLSVKATLAIP